MVLQVTFKKERDLRGPIELTRAWLDVIMNAVAAGEATEGQSGSAPPLQEPLRRAPFARAALLGLHGWAALPIEAGASRKESAWIGR